MFVVKCLVLIGCVLAADAAGWKSCSCHAPSPCGLDSGESMCANSAFGFGKFCEPLVVRPQELPKPEVQQFLPPLPGPCACKKAIVKPAILPKPVCRPGTTPSAGGLFGVSTSSSSNNLQNSLTSTTISKLLSGLESHSMVLGDGGIATTITNPAVLAPADAVSIAIAQQNAQQLCGLDEDRLAFGFRKIPIELPKQKVLRQNNVPEEKIFSLNGQIVELKPVKVCHSTKSLDEEAVEDLLALQEEDTASQVIDEAAAPIKRISLGELGYAPAKIQKKTFIDVPSSEIEAASIVNAAASDAAAAAAAAAGLGLSGFRAGNVVYKTVAKPADSAVAVEDTADCESNEAGEEQSVVYEDSSPYGYGIATCTCAGPCSCAPTMYHSSSSSSSSSASSKFKKASVIIQKLCNQE